MTLTSNTVLEGHVESHINWLTMRSTSSSDGLNFHAKFFDLCHHIIKHVTVIRIEVQDWLYMKGDLWEYGFKTSSTHLSTTSQSIQALSWQTFTGPSSYLFNSLVAIFPVLLPLKITRRGRLCPDAVRVTATVYRLVLSVNVWRLIVFLHVSKVFLDAKKNR